MNRRIQRLRASTLLAVVIVAAGAAAQAALDAATAWAAAVRSSSIDQAAAARIDGYLRGAEVRVTTYAPEGHPAIELVTITASAGSAQPLIDAATGALDRLAAWLGPLPSKRLTVVDVPAQANLAGAAYPGIAITTSRLFTTRREFPAERALTVAIARQYALDLAGAPGSDDWFAEGVAEYFATRAVHETFEGRYYQTERYFGGYVPHSVRAIVMSPNPLDPRPRVADLSAVLGSTPMADEPEGDRRHRFAMALYTLERFIGWPALQATLREFVARHRGRSPTAADLAAVLSEQRGVDTTWFFTQSMRLDAEFDYALVNLTTVAAADGRWQTNVDVRRLGEATFDGTSLPRPVSTARSLPVVTRFEDGSEITEWIDGRDRMWQFQYASASPATLASVDPDVILLLDADRSNNTRSVNPPVHEVGLRLAFNWLSWLQDAMLTCTALL